MPDWFHRMLSDHGNGLSWSNIEPRVPVLVPRGTTEVLLNDLLPPRQSVAPAHWEIMAHRTGVLSFGKRAGMYAFAKDTARSHTAHIRRCSRQAKSPECARRLRCTCNV